MADQDMPPYWARMSPLQEVMRRRFDPSPWEGRPFPGCSGCEGTVTFRRAGVPWAPQWTRETNHLEGCRWLGHVARMPLWRTN